MPTDRTAPPKRRPMNRLTEQLDRPITLLEPQPNQINPNTGATIITDPIRHPVSAGRMALPGDDSISDDTLVRRDRVVYTVRGEIGPAARANATWEVEDGNRRYRIETIYEAPPLDGTRARRRYLKIRAVSYG